MTAQRLSAVALQRQDLPGALYERRTELQQTQQQAADQLGVSLRTFTRWESGVRLDRLDVIQIAALTHWLVATADAVVAAAVQNYNREAQPNADDPRLHP